MNTDLPHGSWIRTHTDVCAAGGPQVYSAGTLILAQGPSMALLFGFEYVVLLAVIVATFFKYVLQCIDLHAENGWDGKAIFVFYADLVLDFVKLAVYLVFFVVVMNFYGLPLHIIRDLCATFRSFAKRLHDFVQSRKATRLLDKYPEATAEQIAQVLHRRMPIVAVRGVLEMARCRCPWYGKDCIVRVGAVSAGVAVHRTFTVLH